eukprot:TRINITY_DN9436_c0_g4_i1.p2 TRINITY_DN9436_c0_g4~~TRINITY_DN9436_c0_g4_i1.p2  ORF type:complete len:150 (-),score=33.08 TRINITY_DN9436_c0_g4_i1:133-582(-)
MGTAQREKLNDSLGLKDNPGPGSYISKSFVGEGPKIGIKQRVHDQANDSLSVPGPGAYQPNLEAVIRKFPEIGIGHGRRNGDIGSGTGSSVPGPGYYNMNDLGKGPKYGFGMEKRQADRFNDVPGPGYYEIPTRIGDGDLPPHERSKHI